MDIDRVCSIEGCGKRLYRLQLCSGHERKLRLYGDPLGGRFSWGGPAIAVEQAVTSDTGECILWKFATAHGYGSLRIGRKTFLAHRIVCERVHGTPPKPGMECAHACGNPLCINPHHLRWATARENNLDKREHGTMARGAAHRWAKLTDAQADAIRAASSTLTQREIAEMFGVTQSHVSRLRRSLRRTETRG